MRCHAVATARHSKYGDAGAAQGEVAERTAIHDVQGFTFDTDFPTVLPFPVRDVPIEHDLTPAAFEGRYRAPGRPVILRGEMQNWTARSAWTDSYRLLELVPADQTVWCRQAIDPTVEYVEEYVEVPFRQLVSEVFDDVESMHYLTQGLVFPPRGFARVIHRESFPALLQSLARDCALPRMIPSHYLSEGVIWIGCAGPVTPLHFDETENLNCVVPGRKRWVMFPQREATNLLRDDHDGRGSILTSLEQLTADDHWHGGDVGTAYSCETSPGDMLYVPAGYVHQVYSGHEPSIAVNFWYSDIGSPRQVARMLRAVSARRMGYRKPAKRIVWAGIASAVITKELVMWNLRRRRVAEPTFEAGLTTYGPTVRLP